MSEENFRGKFSGVNFVWKKGPGEMFWNIRSLFGAIFRGRGNFHGEMHKKTVRDGVRIPIQNTYRITIVSMSSGYDLGTMI